MALSTAWERMATACVTVVATCRQTVGAFLAPLSTAWQRVATGQRVVTGLRVGGLYPYFLSSLSRSDSTNSGSSSFV